MEAQNTGADIATTLLAGAIGGLFVSAIDWVIRYYTLRLKRKNLLNHVRLEMGINIEYAKHNVRRVTQFESGTTKTLNFIEFETIATRNFLADESINVNVGFLNKLSHFIVVAGHVNTILRVFDNERIGGAEVKGYCQNESATEPDSVMKNANEILRDIVTMKRRVC
jgi:hypothetical protein